MKSMIRVATGILLVLVLAGTAAAAPKAKVKDGWNDPTDVNWGRYNGYWGGGHSGYHDGYHYGDHRGYHWGNHSGYHYDNRNGYHWGNHNGWHSGRHTGWHSGDHWGYHHGHGGGGYDSPYGPWNNRGDPTRVKPAARR